MVKAHGLAVISDAPRSKRELATHIPQTAMSSEASQVEVTKGAMLMAPAKMKCEISRPVDKDGFALCICFSSGARLSGAPGVHEFLLSGDSMNQGRAMEAEK